MAAGAQPEDRAAGDGPARVLVVCTANIARSPLAEVLLDAHLRQRGLTDAVTVDSAGIQARSGIPAAEESQLLAAQAGLDLSGHRSRHIDEVDPGSADLVLTMSSRQRDHLGLRVSGLGPRVFTLLEAARLSALVIDDMTGGQEPSTTEHLAPLGPVGASRVARAVLAAHRQRPRSAPSADGDDVADPYGRGEHAYLAMATTVAAAFEPIVDLLFGPAPTAGER